MTDAKGRGTQRPEPRKPKATDKPKAADTPAPRADLLAPVAIALLVAFGTHGMLLASIRPAIRIVALSLASLAAVGGMWACARRTRGDDARTATLVWRAFCVALVALGTLYLVFFPPRTIPDENIHYAASYSFANFLDPTMGQHEVRVEDAEFIGDPVQYNQEFTSDYWEWRKGGFPVFATHTGTVQDAEFAHDVDLGTDTPQLKLFSTIGILLSRLLNLSGILTFYVGRLFNLVPCVVLILLAVRLMPLGKNVLMTIALLPMTLHLLGSYSYDSMILALSFVLVALLLRSMLGEGRLSRRHGLACVAVAVLLAPCKIVYVVLSLLALAVPASRFGSRQEERVWKGLMLALPLLAIVAMRAGKLLVMAGLSGGQNMAARRSSTESLYTLGDILAQPLAPVGMLVRTLFKHGDFYISSMVGGSLAWFQANIAAYQFQVFFLVGLLCVACLSAQDDPIVLGRRPRAAVLATFGLGVLAVFFSMILIWTVAGADIIQGVQGRYFIPLLPLLLVGLRGRVIAVRGSLGPALIAALAGFNLIYLAQIACAVLGGSI